jgi:SAM-dependent methyltransferase
MGLAKAALRFIAREHVRKPFVGPVLTLGRQSVSATLGEARSLVAEEGIAPAGLPRQEGVRTSSPNCRKTQPERHITDVAFFTLLGLAEVQALDCSDFEGAEIVHDLNLPVPAGLHDRFDLIVDGGALEHVFDIRQSLANVARMLRSGGRVIHLSPASNWVNHGFYQFSPTLFYDYYMANGFVGLRGYLAEQDLHMEESRPWEFFEVGTSGRLGSPLGLMTVFVAEKAVASTADRVPMQSLYAQLHSAPRQDEARRRPGGLRAAVRYLKGKRPDGVKALLARYLPGYARRRGLGKLKRWGKL